MKLILLLTIVTLYLTLCIDAKLFEAKATCTITIVPEGGVCSDHTDCLKGFNMCVADSKGTKRCTPFQFKDGQQCSQDSDCSGGNFIPTEGFGATNMMGCMMTNSGGICQFQLRGKDDNCIHNDQCQSGICKNFKCSYLEEFGICDVEQTYHTQCGDGLYCNTNTNVNQCKKKPTQVGEECTYNCYGQNNDLYCALGADTCQKRAAMGETCDTVIVCATGSYCEKPSGSSSGTCTAYKATGNSCTQDFECGVEDVCSQGMCQKMSMACSSNSNVCQRNFYTCSCSMNNADGVCTSTSDNSYTLFFGPEYQAVSACAEQQCLMTYPETSLFDAESCVHRMCSTQIAEHVKYMTATLKTMGINKMPTTILTKASSSTRAVDSETPGDASAASTKLLSAIAVFAVLFVYTL
jgi:hypothetical protein